MAAHADSFTLATKFAKGDMALDKTRFQFAESFIADGGDTRYLRSIPKDQREERVLFAGLEYGIVELRAAFGNTYYDALGATDKALATAANTDGMSEDQKARRRYLIQQRGSHLGKLATSVDKYLQRMQELGGNASAPRANVQKFRERLDWIIKKAQADDAPEGYKPTELVKACEAALKACI